MSLPGVSLTVVDGNLGLQQGSNEQVVLLLGPCTDGTSDTLYSVGNQTTLTNTLGLGKLVEAAGYCLQVGGGPVMCMPIEPNTAGAMSTVTHAGTATGTLTITAAPHKAVTITCVTTGTIAGASAVFTFTVGTAVSAAVTATAGWSSTGYRIPGTYCTYIFATGTYTGSSDVYTITTAGVISHSAGAGATAGTQSASPLDDYQVKVAITTSGTVASGTAQFTYSLDNGNSALGGNGVTSSNIIVGTSGIYVIPNSGLVATFAGQLDSGDTYTFKTVGPTCSSLTSALTALETTYLSQARYAMVGVVQTNVSVTGWATAAATFETAATALFNSGVYVRFMSECPTVGTVFASGSSVIVDSADTDAVCIAARANVSAAHVLVGAGDCLLTSPVTGLTLRRNTMWVAAGRASSVEASQNLGFVGLGGVTGVVYIFRNETATPGMDAAGFTTLRQINGVPGFYITDAHTCSLTTSDYYPFTNARVIDIGCTVVRANALPLVNSKIPTTTRGSFVGVITEKKAQQIEGIIGGALIVVMVDTQPQNAVAANAVVDREHNILADGNLIIAVAIQPFAYARTVTVYIGLAVAA